MNNIKITKEQAMALGVCTERLERLDAFLQHLAEINENPFAAFRVWRKGSPIFSGDYGLQYPSKLPLRGDAIFPLQSVTKPVVATCAAILQEQGLINFFDRVQDRFPEFTGENKERVLLWHLMSHTSGMDEDEIDKKREEQAKLIEESAKQAGFDEENTSKLLNAFWNNEKSIFKMPLTTMPGTKFSYWNFGYDIVKQLIEKVSGVSLEEFARTNIFEPLGMNDTYWVLPQVMRERFTFRPEGIKGTPWMNSDGMLKSTSASGGLKATLDDMIKFGLMFLNGGTYNGKRILSPASVKLLTRNHNEGVPDSIWIGRWLGAGWGLGWDVKGNKIDDIGMLRGEKSFNHGGYGGARLLVDPEYELVVAIYMCERREESVYDYMNCAVDIIYGGLD